jgi:poly(3-hydroxybutyrate) depolymerase
MISKPRSAALVLFFILAIVLAACGGGNRFTELRYDQPSRYYLHVPDGYVEYQQWPLFIALHGIKQNSQDCITEWFEIADENQFFLLCPELVRGLIGP